MAGKALRVGAWIAVPLASALYYARTIKLLENNRYQMNLLYDILLSFVGFVATYVAVPPVKQLALRANLCGRDMAKTDETPIPEALGIVPATVFLICIIFFQLLNFMPTEYNAAMTSICFMIFLGFADDVLFLRWRYKLILPTIAALPLLVAYEGSTVIAIPLPLVSLFGKSVDLGLMYLLYMLVIAVFCTNSINIYAGVNGLEVGQTLVVATAVMLHNIIEIARANAGTLSPGTDSVMHEHHHLFSLFLVIPFIATSLALFLYNRCPSEVFVGDTYTYFAGMALAVLGILGHFSKTLMLFMIPQLLNFTISLPQLFRIVPCPRHRLPKLNPATGKLEAVREHHTLVNLMLWVTGPLEEGTLVAVLMAFQAACCVLAFVVRYFVSTVFYHHA